MKLIGRHREIGIFERILGSKSSEFLAVYGRRRVGKTFLIQQCCSKAEIYFECTGLRDGKLSKQLENFTKEFAKTFYPNLPLQPPQSWKEAFEWLTAQAHKHHKAKRFVLFFDELPWLSSRRSEFMETLDYFWNTEWVHLSNLKLIVCGSAASWMLNKLINAKGGLHNRITKSILLEPFTLAETKEFLDSRGVRLSHEQVLNLYLVMGGIPFYLNHIDKSKSVDQNIHEICFQKDGVLYGEFPRLFKSLFEAAELNLHIVREIAKHRYGIPLSVLVEKTQKKAGGRFQERLDELEATGFIQKFLPFDKKKRGHFYKIVDEYTLFYLRWIEEIVVDSKIPRNVNYWERIRHTPAWESWVGYAYETICYKHSDKIIAALGLTQIGCFIHHWQHKAKALDRNDQGAEIDLLLDRDDNAMTLCEIKYTQAPFVVDKNVAKSLIQKMEVFQAQTGTQKQLFWAIISASGLKKNAWSDEIISHVITLDDLF